MRGRRPGALQLGWSLLVPGRGLRGVGRASTRLQEGRGIEWPEVARPLGWKQRSPTPPSPRMASPRELTQNPLKKIWMPYSNGRPALHACQRGGEAGSAGKAEGGAWAWVLVLQGKGAGNRWGTGDRCGRAGGGDRCVATSRLGGS